MDRRKFLKGAAMACAALPVVALALAPQERAQCVTVTGAVVGGDPDALARELDAIIRRTSLDAFDAQMYAIDSLRLKGGANA